MASCLDHILPHREHPFAAAVRGWRIRQRFRHGFGRPLAEHDPQDQVDKINYRKLYGNHAVYAFLADKYRVREFVRERVGDTYLIPLLGVYDQLTAASFEDLPERFIIKANHGCKWHQIVTDKSRLDVAATARRFNRLLQRRYGRASGEYHYRLIPPRIVIEELLDDGFGPPVDYDFFCFHDGDRFDHGLAVVMPDGKRFAHFAEDGSVAEATCTADELARVADPPNYAEMLDVAERLSRGFDFLRIDLYNVAGRIYFGEVTCTPAGGTYRPIKNLVRAERYARLWKLDRGNPLLYQHHPRAARAA
jgi:hypothetical protein